MTPTVHKVEWFTTNNHTVGLVRAEDNVTGEMFVYLGVGGGYDEENDIQHILDWGAKMPVVHFTNIISNFLV